MSPALGALQVAADDEQAADEQVAVEVPLPLTVAPVALQSLHAVSPTAFWYRPAAQLSQLLLPGSNRNLPAAHWSHPVSPSVSWNRPASQSVQLVRPALAWYCPAPQLLQLFDLHCPAAPEYFPARHSMHSLLPVAGWYLPAPQARHSV